MTRAYDFDDWLFQFGYAIYFGNSPIFWTSGKLKFVAAALNWLLSIFISLLQLLMSFFDNLSTTFMTKNHMSNNWSKHIHIDFHFVLAKVDAHELLVQHTRVKEHVVDVFTKVLVSNCFDQIRSMLHVISLR
ncbi:LOW QUALITY PROTEIN: hypothetical protein V2J09_009041 [Rumex salicifolius]